MILIILLSLIALAFFSYSVQKRSIRRYERNERLKERQQKLLGTLRQNKDKNKTGNSL